MKVRFQFANGDIWEGLPEDAHLSPDPQPPEGAVYVDAAQWAEEYPDVLPEAGIIWIFAIDDFGNELKFAYQDFYYLYSVEDGWLFGAESPKKEFILRPGQNGCEGEPVPFILPERAVVRRAVTVSPELAVHFGFIKEVDEKVLHEKRLTPVECKDCE